MPPWASQYFDQMALIMAHHIPVRCTSKLLQGANRTSLVQPATHGNAPTHALQPNAFPLNLHQWNNQQGHQELSYGSQPCNSQALPLQCNAPECQQVPSQGAQNPNGQALSLQSQVWWQLLASLLLLDAQQNGNSCPLGGFFDALDPNGLQPFGQHNGSFP
jgi:hypothetical protein